MKKSLLALAVLGAFAGAASAQSSVTVFGYLDQGVGKPIGTKDKQVLDGGSSRLGFRGVEDLGGGLAAVFSFEHRFSPDTGMDASTGGTTFWQGHSWVGIKGGFGQVTLGRHYTAAFTEAQNQIDPFGADTVAALRNSGLLIPSTGKTRVSDSVRYEITAAGVKVAATIGEGNQASNTGGPGPDRPWSIGANYTAGPLFVGVGYENPQFANDKLATVGARYTFGPVTARAGYSKGTNVAGADVKGYLVGASVKVGAGEVLAGYAASKNDTTGVDISKKWGLGYRHPLSKRTYLYADVARDSKVTTPAGDPEKSGYDLGIRHTF